jgi:hypothetical protein
MKQMRFVREVKGVALRNTGVKKTSISKVNKIADYFKENRENWRNHVLWMSGETLAYTKSKVR